MRKWIRRALTKQAMTIRDSAGRTVRTREIPPSEKIILLVEFAMISLCALTALEIVHVVYMGSWNSEIFSGITGLIGTITGLFVGAKT